MVQYACNYRLDAVRSSSAYHPQQSTGILSKCTSNRTHREVFLFLASSKAVSPKAERNGSDAVSPNAERDGLMPYRRRRRGTVPMQVVNGGKERARCCNATAERHRHAAVSPTAERKDEFGSCKSIKQKIPLHRPNLNTAN